VLITGLIRPSIYSLVESRRDGGAPERQRPRWLCVLDSLLVFILGLIRTSVDLLA